MDNPWVPMDDPMRWEGGGDGGPRGEGGGCHRHLSGQMKIVARVQLILKGFLTLCTVHVEPFSGLGGGENGPPGTRVSSNSYFFRHNCFHECFSIIRTNLASILAKCSHHFWITCAGIRFASNCKILGCTVTSSVHVCLEPFRFAHASAVTCKKQ